MPIGQLAIESQVGVLARRVEDAALGLEVANGGRFPEGAEWRPLGDPGAVDVSKLTVGYFVDDETLSPCAASVRAVREACEVLESRGARVVPFRPPEIPMAFALFCEIIAGDGGRGFSKFLDGSRQDFRIRQMLALFAAPRLVLAALGPLLRLIGRRKQAELLLASGHCDTASHWRAVESIKDYRARFLGALERASPAPIDVLLSPALALPAVRHGATAELGPIGAYSAIYNVLGYPAGVVPFTRVRAEEETGTPRSKDKMDRTALATERGSAGLPIGVQIAARPFRDHVALAVMGAVEAAARSRPDFPDIDAMNRP
jgi:fatty acid amide hydrolase